MKRSALLLVAVLAVPPAVRAQYAPGATPPESAADAVAVETRFGKIIWDSPRKFDIRLQPWGLVRLAYESVESDDRYSFIGRNDGFILDNARVGLDSAIGKHITTRVSLEAASDLQEDTNTPIGEIDVRLLDGYARWDPYDFVGVQVGQFSAPFSAEELRSRNALLFVSRAVGVEGVLTGRGFQTPGLEVDRQIGVMFSSAGNRKRSANVSYIPRGAITLESLGLADGDIGQLGLGYYLMISNGNGDNELLNDNSKLMVIGRLEAVYSDIVTLGGAILTNDRTVGTPPNRFDENDTGYAADLLVTPFDLELFFQYIQFDTDFKTVGVEDRTQRAWHVQAGYRFNIPLDLHVTPAYRFAQFDPWAEGGDTINGIDGDANQLNYHTLGLRLGHREYPITAFFNYTITEEEDPRELDNDRLQFLVQVEL